MVLQVGERARLAEAGEIVAMGVEPDARGADAPRKRRALRRPHHAHGDVGVAPREILVAVGERKLDRDAGMRGMERGEDRREHLARRRRRLAVSRTTPRSAAASPEAVRANAAAAAAIASACGAKASAAARRRKAAGRAGEQRRSSAASSASMWRPTVGWLRPSRRAAPDRLPSRAHLDEGAQFVPVWRAPSGHTLSYSRTTKICNFVYRPVSLPQECDASPRLVRRCQGGSRAGTQSADRFTPVAAPAQGFASGGVRMLLRLEGLRRPCAAVAVLRARRGSPGRVRAFFLAPDLAMLAYLAGPRAGAIAYNLAHTYALALAAHARRFSRRRAAAAAGDLIWIAHIGFDRALGYGLKYSSGFGDTHLGRIGRR